jgi:hypothetical protein
MVITLLKQLPETWSTDQLPELLCISRVCMRTLTTRTAMFRCFHIILIVFFPLILSASTVQPVKSERVSTQQGYSVLKIFLEDEQYLTAIRYFKTVISFSATRQPVADLVDDIADISEYSLEQLEELAEEKPEIHFNQLEENSVAVSTLDSLRYTTARRFINDTANFEKNILLSQVQILPVIAHLAQTLQENETNLKRKYWLHKLSLKFTVLYRRAYAQLYITQPAS